MAAGCGLGNMEGGMCASSLCSLKCSLCAQFVHSYFMDCTVSWDMLIDVSCQIIS